MALIVEDGSIVTGAESYCTVAFANTYLANRGYTAWDALMIRTPKNRPYARQRITCSPCSRDAGREQGEKIRLWIGRVMA